MLHINASGLVIETKVEDNSKNWELSCNYDLWR
jgi:hypothetical protein